MINIYIYTMTVIQILFLSQGLTPNPLSFLILNQPFYFFLWVFNNSPLPKESICLKKNMRVVVPPKSALSLNSSQDTVFPDTNFKIPYPGSPGGGSLCQKSEQKPFESKGLRKCHPIIVKQITIRSPQTDTFT